jgi:two-component system, sensor histidine kinase PdtaS
MPVDTRGCGGIVEKLLAWLPKRTKSPLARYGLATAIMAVCCVVQLAFAAYAGLPGLFDITLGIWVCALLGGKGPGFYAAFLGTISSFIVIEAWFPAIALGSLAIFLVAAIGLVLLTDALRVSLERAVTAEQEKSLLLRELSHRTQNNLALAASILHLESRSQANADVTAALDRASARINVLAELQRHLERASGDAVDLGSYIKRVCERVHELMQGSQRTVHCDAEPIIVSWERAVTFGLIANELITNSLKHAFGQNESGKVAVSLRRDGAEHIKMTVTDDGIGSADLNGAGAGTRIIDMMVERQNGTIARESANPGLRVSVTLPR